MSRATEEVEVLVVGAGQAGIAMSEHLGRCGIPHLVLERDRVAERWRSGRWDSLVANGPAWHDRFPGMEFPDAALDSFPTKDAVADYFAAYAESISAPIRCGVAVDEVRRRTGQPGFEVRTSEGVITARYVVAATGPFQHPVIPPLIPQDAGIDQLHSSTYRNPEQLADGAVIVIGAGASGSQIADELLRSGRDVYLSVGPHSRYPRRYRGHDYCWWLGVLGLWDIEAPAPDTEHVTIAVSGAYGGFTVDFREFASRGMTLVGKTINYEDGKLTFADGLEDLILKGDADYLSVLDAADAYVTRNGLDLPQDPAARAFKPMPDCATSPILELDLATAGVSTVLWATGYTQDFDWLNVNAFQEDGKPDHQRGVASEPGIYFLGLPWLARRGSSFIWGVWHDAQYIAHHIATHRGYMAYHTDRKNSSPAG